MKISTSLALVALAEAGQTRYRAPKKDESGQKITGKHPMRRLQALNKFACAWLADNEAAGVELNGWKRNASTKVCNIFTNWSVRMSETFQRPECAFYDPNVKFGGPDPNAQPGKRSNGKDRRLRRDADDDDYEDDEELTEEEVLNDDDTSCSDEDGSAAALAGTGLCEGKERKSKLSAVNRKWRRINTGYAKWCNRYVSECYGQRVYDHCVNRAAKFFKNFKLD